MATVKEVVSSYQQYLRVKCPGHSQRFERRLKHGSESAKAEAVVFSLLRARGFTVEVAEDLGTGGVDYLCRTTFGDFLAEATCLRSSSLTRHSGLEDHIAATSECASFSFATRLFRRKLSSKAPQLADSPHPRLLIVVGFHAYSSVLLGKAAAENLITGDRSVAVSIPDGPAIGCTNLNTSAFIRRSKSGTIEPCRQSISAILLLQVHHESSSVCGVLHPKPVVPFPLAAFPRTPFVRLKEWAPSDRWLELEWVIDDPLPWCAFHELVGFQDWELRQA